MKARVAVAIVVLAAAGASAQDGAKPAKPGDPGRSAPPAPVAKKERKSSPEAEAAMKKYVSLLHFPSSKYQFVEMSSHCDVPALGGEVGCKFTIKDGDVRMDIALPEAAVQQTPPSQLAGIKKSAAGLVGRFFKPFIVPADLAAKQYDLSAKTENGKTIVEWKRYADDAAWDKATLTFNAEGLLEKQVGMPNADPDDPMAMAGSEIETTFSYKKRGDLYSIEGVKIVDPMGETDVKLGYFELADQPVLPKLLDVTSPVFGNLSISVHDFVLDGKKIVGTERKEEPKPAPPPPGLKKDEPPKPAK